VKIDAYFVLVTLSIMVVLSYSFNYISARVKIPSVLLLIGSGIGLKFVADYFSIRIPSTGTLLEILGIAGLIFIVLEAALDLVIERQKLRLIIRAFVSALGLLGFTSVLLATVFSQYFQTSFRLALLHAIPLSVISSAIAIPSVSNMSDDKREFVIYESTFSDILGIIAFNFLVVQNNSGLHAVGQFSLDILLIVGISIVSTVLLIFLLNRSTSNVRFFLTFAVLILAYSFAKYLHLPSLILVLCFGLVLNNFKSFDYPFVHRFLAMEKLAEATRELRLMTAETAFIIRTFFFLLFGYSIDLTLLESYEVLALGLGIIAITIVLRFVFLRFVLHITSAPLMLIAPRGLITVLLFYSIPAELRIEKLSEGVLFIVIAFTGLAMTLGLLLNKRSPREKIEDLI
jgi:Kef-type K+ transport system membrane component KefB